MDNHTRTKLWVGIVGAVVVAAFVAFNWRLTIYGSPELTRGQWSVEDFPEKLLVVQPSYLVIFPGLPEERVCKITTGKQRWIEFSTHRAWSINCDVTHPSIRAYGRSNGCADFTADTWRLTLAQSDDFYFDMLLDET